jgi:hypothetical protein
MSALLTPSVYAPCCVAVSLTPAREKTSREVCK